MIPSYNDHSNSIVENILINYVQSNVNCSLNLDKQIINCLFQSSFYSTMFLISNSISQLDFHFKVTKKFNQLVD